MQTKVHKYETHEESDGENARIFENVKKKIQPNPHEHGDNIEWNECTEQKPTFTCHCFCYNSPISLSLSMPNEHIDPTGDIFIASGISVTVKKTHSPKKNKVCS